MNKYPELIMPKFRLFRGYYFLLLFLAVLLLAFALRHENRHLYGAVSTVKKIVTPLTIDSSAITTSPQGGYAVRKRAINQMKGHWHGSYQRAFNSDQKKLVLDSARNYFTQALVNQLIPHWYGTVWSFEGHTETPQQGEIACGYFVSTLLNHAGLQLNRYKMAQQNPVNEVRTLHQQENSIFFEAETAHGFRDSVKRNLKEGLYIFGLTNHVGFLLHHQSEVYLIHSNYLFPFRKVIVELASQSPLLFHPKECILGDITHNDKLMRQWLSGKPVAIVEK